MFVAGCVSFALLFLSDIDECWFKVKASRILFAIGFLLLSISTTMLCIRGFSENIFSFGIRAIFSFSCAMFVALLIYTLFFALPFKNTYVSSEVAPSEKNVKNSGVYALCRHPGIIWFFLLYVSLWGATGLRITEAFVFSGLNLLYAAFQDIFIFPHTIDGYMEYKKNIPFLIPSPKSIRMCFGNRRVTSTDEISGKT